MSNPAIALVALIDQILLGADAFYSDSGVAEQRYLHEGICETALVVIQNFGDVSITVTVAHSDDDGDSDPYEALDLRVRGSTASSVTVLPRTTGVFSIEGFLTPGSVKKWIKVSASARDANGRLSLLAFTGAFTRISPAL